MLVVRRGGNDVEWIEGRDIWWHEVVPQASAEHEAQAFPAETPLFILYTSGTTGKPKGIMHTSGGYLTQAAFSNKVVHDLHPESDVFWCTADIGWITGHSYVTYGPLANGATQVLYEGTPDTPHPGRWWEIIQKYGVTILYTAPTAIRSFMKLGRAIPEQYDLSSLRLLGSVGEPINPEAWMWYRKIIGGKVAPIVDTWWQTETGAIMISALPGVTETKPGSAQVPLPGVLIEVVDDDGAHVGNGNGGLLVVTEPWPSMLRGIWGDPERYKETYWDKFAAQGYYFAGDGARLDEDGDVWLLGRVDDVMNVSGHRLSTTEIESALVANEAVAEAAVVGASDETTGQAVAAFVIIKQSYLAAHSPDGLAQSLRAWVGEQIGPIARPRDVYIVEELPKTRSGKIMRRLLRDVAEGREVGDTTTLADTAVMSVISAQVVPRLRPRSRAEDHFDLDGTVERKDRDPDSGARVPARLTEDLAEHIAGAVDHARLAREIGDGCHEPDDLDDTGQPVDTADGRRGGRDRVERALARESLSVGRGDQPGALADLARRRERA